MRRPLTDAEMRAILSGIDTAQDVSGVWIAAVSGIYGPLLADTGRCLAGLDEDVCIDPDAFAIPALQWRAILAAAANRLNAWGTAAQLALFTLELAAVLPATYDDPTVPIWS